MQIIRQFCSTEEIQQLLTIWRSGTGWEARGTYIFTPCIRPPVVLVERARQYLPVSTKTPYSDSFFLHYLDQKALAEHVDARSAVRLNVLVIKPEDGGEFFINHTPAPMNAGDAIVFNPDTEPHGTTRLIRGERLIWSIGRTRNEQNPVKILTRKQRRAAEKRGKPFGIL